AALALLRTGDDTFFCDLIRIVSTSERLGEWRGKVVGACEDLFSAGATRFLVDRLVHDPSSQVKVRTLRCLKKRGSLEVRVAMEQILAGEFPIWLKNSCAGILASWGSSEATDFLVRNLKNESLDNSDRQSAASNLESSRDEAARAA